MNRKVILFVLIAGLAFASLLAPTPNTQASLQSATPTPSPTDLILTGKVTDRITGIGIAKAFVSITSCFPRSFMAQTDLEGDYSLFVPASYVCGSLPITVSAKGYRSCHLPNGAAYIAAHGTEIDFALWTENASSAVRNSCVR